MKSALLALTLAALAATGARAEVVRIATEGAYPPWNFVNERNEVDGFERELGDELCRRAGLTCAWVVAEWDALIPGLLAGNHDAVIGSLSITPARRGLVAFSEPYVPPEPSAFFAPEGAGLEVTRGTVATQSNTFFADYLHATEAVVMEFPNPEDVVAAVRNGVADAGLFDTAFLDPILAESGGALVYVGQRLFLTEGVGVGLRQSDTALRAAFDAGIRQMKTEGALNAMITRWFGGSLPLFD